jgi:hypothetical protein
MSQPPDPHARIAQIRERYAEYTNRPYVQDILWLLDQLAQAEAREQQVRALGERWYHAEREMRLLEAGLPGSGYDKLADGYGTCAEELADALTSTITGDQK